MAKANGCGEFWINRYQTSIQTVVSGLIGGAGLFFVLRQLSEISHQNEMTQRALEATTRNSARDHRRAAGKAISAINEYAKLSGRLALLCALVMGKQVSNAGQEIPEKDFAAAARNLADIYEALDSDSQKAAWVNAQREFEALTAYIMARGSGLTVSQAVQLGRSGYMGPTTDAEAMDRAVNLSVAFANIRDLLKL